MVTATTITWIGGSGNWFDKGQWDTGTIPTFSDEVIITGGQANIDGGNAEAKKVRIDAGAELIIHQNSLLHIQFEQYMTGLENNGDLTNMGELIVRNPFSESNTAFVNNSRFHNRGGAVEILQSGLGFRNTSTGETTNEGSIEIHDLFGVGGGGLSNLGTFTNDYGATIFLHHIGVTSYVLSNFGTNATFNNYGDIEIANCQTMSGEGIQVTEGLFNNEAGASIYISDTGNTSLFVNQNGTFRNRGDIQIFYAGSSSIIVSGFFVNHQSGYIFCSGSSNHGLETVSGGEFRNFGNLYTINSGSRSLNNYGIFNNYPKGKFQVNYTIQNAGYFHNMGNMSTYHTGTNVIINALNNNGIIGDENETFSISNINNSGVIVHPINGNVTVGVPVSNALQLGSLNNVTVVRWTIGQSSSTIAGTYDSNTNTFTPNADAAGLTEIYVTLRRANSGLTKKYKVPVPNGIQNPSPRLGLISNGLEGTQESQAITGTGEEFKVYPNPTTNHFQIHGNEDMKHLEIVDQMGRIILTEKAVNLESLIQLPAGTTPGIYIVRIQNAEGKTTSKQIIVQ